MTQIFGHVKGPLNIEHIPHRGLGLQVKYWTAKLHVID